MARRSKEGGGGRHAIPKDTIITIKLFIVEIDSKYNVNSLYESKKS